VIGTRTGIVRVGRRDPGLGRDEGVRARLPVGVNASNVRELGDGDGSTFGVTLRQVVKYLYPPFAMVVANRLLRRSRATVAGG